MRATASGSARAIHVIATIMLIDRRIWERMPGAAGPQKGGKG